MSDEFDIFNLSADNLITPQKTGKGGEIYSPTADKGRDGIYKALIRFLPNVRNSEKSKIKKSYYWLEDPVSGESFSVDDPATVGKKSILADTFWKLKKSTSARDQELSEKFSNVTNFYSLVQIIKDPNQPELEGKIMVFKFGIKINQKIEALLKPEFGDPTNPFDLFEGKMFALHVVKKQKWNNFDLCEFVGERTPLILDGKPIQKTKEDMSKVVDYLKNNSPELEKYDYKEWTDETHEKVLNAIRNIIPDGRLVEQILGGKAGAKPAATAQAPQADAQSAATSKPQTSFDDLMSTGSQNPAPQAEKKATGSVSSLDDLYNNL